MRDAHKTIFWLAERVGNREKSARRRENGIGDVHDSVGRLAEALWNVHQAFRRNEKLIFDVYKRFFLCDIVVDDVQNPVSPRAEALGDVQTRRGALATRSKSVPTAYHRHSREGGNPVFALIRTVDAGTVIGLYPEDGTVTSATE